MQTEDQWVEDDRVLCKDCWHAMEMDCRQSVPAEQMEKHRKVNARPLQWMFENAKIRNGWATVTWSEWKCQPTGMAVIPDGIRHRCHMFKAKPASVESDAWWLT